MSTINNGGSAFPQDIGWVSPNQHVQYRGPQGGMTLRDYFAAKAMQGLIASNDEGAGDRIEDVPGYAYVIADAMLEARK